jgi:hypothetical protein
MAVLPSALLLLAEVMRAGRPVAFTSLTEDPSATAVAGWLTGARRAWRSRTAQPWPDRWR